MLVVLLVLFLLSLHSVGDACSDHVGWFRLYKPVVVSHDLVSFIQACSCVDVTFEYNSER